MTDVTTLLAGIKTRALIAGSASVAFNGDSLDQDYIRALETSHEDVPRLVAALEAGLSRMEERAKMLRETSDRMNQQVMDRDINRDLENATRYAHYSTEADAGFRQLRTAVVAALGGGE